MVDAPTGPKGAPVKPGGRGQGQGGRGGKAGARRAPKSRYGTQMEEKQNLKEIFGIREEQLRKYYREAKRSSEETGPELISLLERRLDNTVYRAGFATTRGAARQMTTHRLFTVNNRPVDVPSYRVKPGDVVSVRENKRGKALFSNFEKRMQNVNAPSWILIDGGTYSFKVTGDPQVSEAMVGVDVQAIVEYFAR